jgi:hypothetical protein
MDLVLEYQTDVAVLAIIVDRSAEQNLEAPLLIGNGNPY